MNSPTAKDTYPSFRNNFYFLKVFIKIKVYKHTHTYTHRGRKISKLLTTIPSHFRELHFILMCCPPIGTGVVSDDMEQNLSILQNGEKSSKLESLILLSSPPLSPLWSSPKWLSLAQTHRQIKVSFFLCLCVSLFHLKKKIIFATLGLICGTKDLWSSLGMHYLLVAVGSWLAACELFVAVYDI